MSAYSRNSERSNTKEYLSNPHESEVFSPEKEALLDILDVSMANYLKYSSKDNEGQEALIYEFNIETNFQNESPEQESELEQIVGDTHTIKLLKVLNPDKAKEEFAWQEKAYNIIEAIPHEEQNNYAKIPKPVLNRTLPIDSLVKDRLNAQNANLNGESASVILMEWIDGQDLLTSAFKNYLVKSSSGKEIAEKPNVDFRALRVGMQHVAAEEGVDLFALSTAEQYKYLFQRLERRKTPIISEAESKKLKKTIDLLHKNGIYHNDLHLRNVLRGDDSELYLIDFGRSDNQTKNHEDNIDDLMIVRYAEQYGLHESRNEEEQKLIIQDFERIINRDPKYKVLLQKIKSLKTKVNLEKYVHDQESLWNYDEWELKRFCAFVYDMKKRKNKSADYFAQLLDSNRSKIKAGYQKNIAAVEV